MEYLCTDLTWGISTTPCLKFHSPPIKEEWIRELDEHKLIKLINKGYLEDAKGRCKVVIPRHQVPKVNSDIWVVWNLTKNGVKATLLSPYLFLCTIASLCRRLEPGDDQRDFDIKEQYHNYLLHVSERAYHGVIIPPRVCQDNNVELATPLMRFTRVHFGWGLHYTVYLLRFNMLIMRIKIWNRSAPKRYVHNKLCTELIFLKS
jgi:hypothetical protein